MLRLEELCVTSLVAPVRSSDGEGGMEIDQSLFGVIIHSDSSSGQVFLDERKSSQTPIPVNAAAQSLCCEIHVII